MKQPDIICHFCGGTIARPQENWGWHDSPICLTCHLEMSAMSAWEEQQDHYGLAPHTHDLTITGSHIGSTVMTPLPAPVNGVIDLGWAWFTPDGDAPGMGVYSPKGPAINAVTRDLFREGFGAVEKGATA